jgi:hypothetical protein
LPIAVWAQRSVALHAGDASGESEPRHQHDRCAEEGHSRYGQPNADGSVTLYFQNESPGPDKEANWLPAPKGEFIPMMRMYYPTETSPSIIDGSWKIPPVVRVS